MTDVLLVTAIVVIAAITAQVNAKLEEVARTPQRGAGEVGALPDGRTVRIFSLGFDRLIADLYWIRTVYYVGDEASAAAGYPDVNRLAELVTDIDPKFKTAYVTMSGAIGALKGDPDGAIALLEKGIRNVDYWKLHFLLGFSYFIERFDYAAAARQMELAAQKDGPSYLALLAARLRANAGDTETALAFVHARLGEETDVEMRKALEKRYWDLWINRDLQRIQTAIDSYRELSGRSAGSVSELIEAGLLTFEPKDPRGGMYRIKDGQAVTDLPHDTLQMHVPYHPRRSSVSERSHASESERGIPEK